MRGLGVGGYLLPPAPVPALSTRGSGDTGLRQMSSPYWLIAAALVSSTSFIRSLSGIAAAASAICPSPANDLNASGLFGTSLRSSAASTGASRR